MSCNIDRYRKRLAACRLWKRRCTIDNERLSISYNADRMIARTDVRLERDKGMQTQSRGAATRRRVLGTSAGALGSAVLAACSGGGQGSSGGQAAVPAASAAPAKITFAAHGDQSWQEVWNKLVGMFNNQNGPKVTTEFVSTEPDQWTKYRVLIASGEMYDVFRNEEKRLPEFAKNGALLDITSLAARDKDTKKEDFPESIWNEFFYEGKQYGFGHDISPGVIFYNRGLFKQAGVALPATRWGDPAWTWQKFLDTAKALTRETGGGKVWGTDINTWWVYAHPFVWSNGGAVVSKDSKKVEIDSPAAIEALEYYADLRLKHRVAPTAAELRDAGGTTGGFERGRLAMRIDNVSYTIRMRQLAQQDPQWDWDVAPYPTGKAGAFTRVANNLVTGYKGSKAPEAVWAFLKFMASKEATVDARAIPSRLSVAGLPEVLNRTKEQNWKLLADAGKVRRSEVLSPYYNEFDDLTLRPAYVDVLDGKRTVREMVADVKPRLQDILDGKGAGGR
jgi:multiple sugar transport system substrate-binding protein